MSDLEQGGAGNSPSREALLKAQEALNAWLGTYALDLVSDDTLRRAGAVIRAGGGTLSYIAECQRMIAFALQSEGIPHPPSGDDHV